MKIQKLLNKSHSSETLDKLTFTKYQKKEIDIKKCLQEFYENNHIPKDLRNIEEQEFMSWLNSLGY